MSASAYRSMASPAAISRSCALTFMLRCPAAHSSRPVPQVSDPVTPPGDPFSSLTKIGALPEPLTAREHEVLALLIHAKTNREIAEELVISLRTVECHLSTIYGKLGVRGRSEAMLWAVNTDMRPEPGGSGREAYRSVGERRLPTRILSSPTRKRSR